MMCAPRCRSPLMPSVLRSARTLDRWCASTARSTGGSDTSSSSVRSILPLFLPRLRRSDLTSFLLPLAVELPVDIHAMDATYETQFGVVTRPTHRNTSWDQAKFEVCAHRFADLSEFGYGVAVVNDCKYGYGIEGQTIRLSLLRSPTAPDAEQDQGLHQFSFGIVPHLGTFVDSCVSSCPRFDGLSLLIALSFHALQ